MFHHKKTAPAYQQVPPGADVGAMPTAYDLQSQQAAKKPLLTGGLHAPAAVTKTTDKLLNYDIKRSSILFQDLSGIQLNQLVDGVLNFCIRGRTFPADLRFPRVDIGDLPSLSQAVPVPGQVMAADANLTPPGFVGFLVAMLVFPLTFIQAFFSWFTGREKMRNDLALMRRKASRLVLALAWMKALAINNPNCIGSMSVYNSDQSVIICLLQAIQDRMQALCFRKKLFGLGFKLSSFRIREESHEMKNLLDRVENVLTRVTAAYDINWDSFPAVRPEDSLTYFCRDILTIDKVGVGMFMPTWNNKMAPAAPAAPSFSGA